MYCEEAADLANTKRITNCLKIYKLILVGYFGQRQTQQGVIDGQLSAIGVAMRTKLAPLFILWRSFILI